MKFTTNRTRAITVMALILFISTLTLMTNISVKAQDDQPHGGAPQLNAWATSPPPGVTPSVTVTSTAFMSFRPDPVGLAHTIMVNIWLEPATHYNRYRSGYSVTLT